MAILCRVDQPDTLAPVGPIQYGSSSYLTLDGLQETERSYEMHKVELLLRRRAQECVSVAGEDVLFQEVRGSVHGREVRLHAL